MGVQGSGGAFGALFPEVGDAVFPGGTRMMGSGGGLLLV